MKDKVLAIDIGEKRVGVAISDALGMLAHPFKTIRWKTTTALVYALKEIIEQEKVVSIIVGMPYTLKGGYSKKTEEVHTIAEALKEQLPVPVILQDERLTTKMAEDALRLVGKQPS
jgi:putative Holliday junction resolvase